MAGNVLAIQLKTVGHVLAVGAIWLLYVFPALFFHEDIKTRRFRSRNERHLWFAALVMVPLWGALAYYFVVYKRNRVEHGEALPPADTRQTPRRKEKKPSASTDDD
jgi:NADH:ubiquinone oxidoreductase subunit 6 (subunit J)